ncbi:MAG: vitamin B12 dependent-methionine synthase activation domain-containing protein [Lachnospiraceae bacterium]
MKKYLKTINRNEVLKYIGYTGGDVEEKLEEDIRSCSREVMEYARPRVSYRVFELEQDYCLRGTDFIPGGQDVKQMLSGCDQVVLMAATIGSDIEKLTRRYEVDDLYKALILDACASSAIENVCDNFQEELTQKVGEQGKYLTDRFSPGYGDMPFEQQHQVCAILNTEKTIGVSLSKSGIMIPRKSVTAVMGISDTEKPQRFRGCEHCSMFEKCTFRKGGTTCGKA